MSYQDIRDSKEGFVRGDIGDGFVRLECFFLGLGAFLGLWKGGVMNFIPSLAIGVIITNALPWLIGLIDIFAWIAAVVFSIVWAAVGGVLGYLIFEGSIIAAIMGAIFMFICSFFGHKVFAGIGYVSEKKTMIDSVTSMSSNLESINNAVSNNMKYCSNCGQPVKIGANFCESCGQKQ